MNSPRNMFSNHGVRGPATAVVAVVAMALVTSGGLALAGNSILGNASVVAVPVNAPVIPKSDLATPNRYPDIPNVPNKPIDKDKPAATPNKPAGPVALPPGSDTVKTPPGMPPGKAPGNTSPVAPPGKPAVQVPISPKPPVMPMPPGGSNNPTPNPNAPRPPSDPLPPGGSNNPTPNPDVSRPPSDPMPPGGSGSTTPDPNVPQPPSDPKPPGGSDSPTPTAPPPSLPPGDPGSNSPTPVGPMPPLLPDGPIIYLPVPTAPPGPMPTGPTGPVPSPPADPVFPSPPPPELVSVNAWDWTLDVNACDAMTGAEVGRVIGDTIVKVSPLYRGACNYEGSMMPEGGQRTVPVNFMGADNKWLERFDQGHVPVTGVGDKATWDYNEFYGTMYAYQGKYAVVITINGIASEATGLANAKSLATTMLNWVNAQNPPVPAPPTSQTPFPSRTSGGAFEQAPPGSPDTRSPNMIAEALVARAVTPAGSAAPASATTVPVATATSGSDSNGNNGGSPLAPVALLGGGLMAAAAAAAGKAGMFSFLIR